jgi:hypothetical protein
MNGHSGETPSEVSDSAQNCPDYSYCEEALRHSFLCPYCGEEISMVLDLSVSASNLHRGLRSMLQTNSFTVEDDDVANFTPKPLARSSGASHDGTFQKVNGAEQSAPRLICPL